VTVQSEYGTPDAIIQSIPVATASASVCKFGLNSVVMAAFYCWQFRKHVNGFPSPETERIIVSPPQRQICIVFFRFFKLIPWTVPCSRRYTYMTPFKSLHLFAIYDQRPKSSDTTTSTA